MIAKTYCALGFFMHQPPHSFWELVENKMGELICIINKYQYPLKYINLYPGSMKAHVSFSGVLLEQLLNREIIEVCHKIIDIPSMLLEYKESKEVEIIGCGYSNPLFSLIPVEDWDTQVLQGKEIVMEIFDREPKGFHVPEAGFCPELIPILKKYGYEYIIMDNISTKPVKASKDKSLSAPMTMSYNGLEIGVVPVHYYVGGQKDGTMAPDGTHIRTKTAHEYKSKNRLKVVWVNLDGIDAGSDSSREEGEDIIFTYMEQLIDTGLEVKSVLLREFIRDYKLHQHVDTHKYKVAAKGTDDYASMKEEQSEYSLRAREEVYTLSQRYHEIRSILLRKGDRSLNQGYLLELLDKAQKWLLKSETDCYFSSDPIWAAKLYDTTKPGLILLDEIRKKL